MTKFNFCECKHLMKRKQNNTTHQYFITWGVNCHHSMHLKQTISKSIYHVPQFWALMHIL